MNKNKLKIFIFIFIFIYMSGCNKNNVNYDYYDDIDVFYNSNLTVLPKALNYHDFKNRIPEYDSELTIGFHENGLNYIYMFSTPIQFYTNTGYKLISNDLIESSFKNYLYQNRANNIKTYFPKDLYNEFLIKENRKNFKITLSNLQDVFDNVTLVNHLNIFGDEVNSALYSSANMDYFFYSSKAGINSEIVIKNKNISDITFLIDGDGAAKYNEGVGYIEYSRFNEIKEIVYLPVLKAVDGSFYICDDIDFIKGKIKWKF